MRTESDSLGQLNIPKTAYYGIHTQRALHNFPISSQPTHPELIRAFLEIKQAAAKTNATSGNLDRSVAKHIVSATKTLLNNPIDLSMFPISDIQGGAGTSANMNVNEVIANVALEQTGRARGDYAYINPNDDVNMAQSTNDTYPSAGKIALLRLLDPLLLELQNLIDALGNKADEFSTTYKMGRTQLQDAVPMTLGNSFHAWLKPLLRDDLRIKTARDALYMLNLGGSAIGSGINVSYHYQVHIVPNLAGITKLPLTQAHDLFDATQNLDGLVALSGTLKTLAMSLSKISNDLRLLSSGPRSGLLEINLPAKQAGSSIMPGKVNPVIPEVVNQVAFEMFGFDATITAAAEAGQLELNAFEPIIFRSLFAGIEHLTSAMTTLRLNAIDGITSNKSRLAQDIDLSVSFATAMTPIIGYQEAAKLAKESIRTGKSLRQLAEKKSCFTPDQLTHIFKIEDIVINARTPEHGLVLHAPTQ
ncbi:aspartate ammonia-lyase [Leuconostoc gasicomitatum]|uniref:Aspartate ammonia-lyase n=2 Tax=Leuconostoc TaxID=1243 RepID=A0AAN2UH28_9LACO|nr:MULTISPECIES: aspartate ammonia-lyase [Leuconostoc]MBZ5947399.1 aspartate ammonia-lyase [Leuconostoc gasicomitatum]MBZ5956929.1 aspartate ammonia-lyase [Leuconostoc gasicomitatum]MBZ5958315.1 aspartate ammonia-lyase [Leuconostoc gasicomitatum]MBZ5960575.1 aspartate ammonia-lyase [Leuconostoc gasicomitatum]MBZ5961589.1 aspartate ammonia-lyase [Leuconostoc gasicomitatum]